MSLICRVYRIDSVKYAPPAVTTVHPFHFFSVQCPTTWVYAILKRGEDTSSRHAVYSAPNLNRKRGYNEMRSPKTELPVIVEGDRFVFRVTVWGVQRAEIATFDKEFDETPFLKGLLTT